MLWMSFSRRMSSTSAAIISWWASPVMTVGPAASAAFAASARWKCLRAGLVMFLVGSLGCSGQAPLGARHSASLQSDKLDVLDQAAGSEVLDHVGVVRGLVVLDAIALRVLD